MTTASAGGARSEVSWGPWLWSPRMDIVAFGGSAMLALGLVSVRHLLGFGHALPEWAWIGAVLCVDVAHVYATLFRTYADRRELKRKPLRYFGLPPLLYLLSVLLCLAALSYYWRVLAYLAVAHFVRQQIGWCAVYRSRAGVRGLQRWLDDAVLYVATGGALLFWHLNLDSRRFEWFLLGDFVNLSQRFQGLFSVVLVVLPLLLIAHAALQVSLFRKTRCCLVGRNLVVYSTVCVWWVGVVWTNSDFDFTVTNVIPHGVPYLVLCYAYASSLRQNQRQALMPLTWGSRIMAFGVLGFGPTLLVFATFEEALWNRFVWPDHEVVFGQGAPLSGRILSWLVPLLGLPQLTHYVLDGIIWRRDDTRTLQAQASALGVNPQSAEL